MASESIRSRLGIPESASHVVVLDQAAHMDWDWNRTFWQDFLAAGNYEGANGVLLAALKLLAANTAGSATPYYYSICEMSFLRKFIEYQQAHGNNVLAQFQSAGDRLRLVGGGITSPDNLVCAGEAFLRNYLRGKLWLARNLPELLPLKHCWIPDDFGQDPELPVAVAALGMISVGFGRLNQVEVLSQKGWDFRWTASDQASRVIGHFMVGNYNQASSIDNTPPGPCANIQSYLCSNYVNGQVPEYTYVPVINDFMVPLKGLLQDVDRWNNLSGCAGNFLDVYAVEASFDHYISLIQEKVGSLPEIAFNGTPYWTGYYASRPALKALHYETTRNLLAAEAFGLMAAASPEVVLDPRHWEDVAAAWDDFLPSTHHDYICGTATDDVYLGEQLPLLRKAASAALFLAKRALTALGASIDFHPCGEPRHSDLVIAANPCGSPFQSGAVELTGLFGAGLNSIRINTSGSPLYPVQYTYERGLLLPVPLPPLSYITGAVSSEPTDVTIKPATIAALDGTVGYTLSNEYLKVVISAAASWGVESITDAAGKSWLSAPGNQLVFYEDDGGIYRFGNEDGETFQAQSVHFTDAVAPVVLEHGPLRVRLRVVLSVLDLPAAGTYTLEYELVAGEPFLRMSVTGAAPPCYSVMTAFPLTSAIESIVHGTPSHWTAVQPQTDDAWPPPVFRATHRFLAARDGKDQPLAVVYHPEVPAWAFCSNPLAKTTQYEGSNYLIGCLFRNTPRSQEGAAGSDYGIHKVRYAFRPPPDDLSIPVVLGEALSYTMPPFASAVASVPYNSTSHNSLPLAGTLASVDPPGFILAAKPGDVVKNSLILRLYQPTNSPQLLTVRLAKKPLQVVPVTALEDPIPQVGGTAPQIAITPTGFTIQTITALNTVQITFSS